MKHWGSPVKHNRVCFCFCFFSRYNLPFLKQVSSDPPTEVLYTSMSNLHKHEQQLDLSLLFCGKEHSIFKACIYSLSKYNDHLPCARHTRNVPSVLWFETINVLSRRVTVTCIITVVQTGGLAQNSGLRGPCSLESLMVPGTGRHPEPMPGLVCVLAFLSHLLGAPQTYTSSPTL